MRIPHRRKAPTPSENFDAIVASGRDLTVRGAISPEELVNLDKFPWVCPEMHVEPTSLGDVHMSRGFLLNGASGLKFSLFGFLVDPVGDLDPRASGSHDKLFQDPYVVRHGVRVRVTFKEANAIYAELLCRYHLRSVARTREAGLNVFGRIAWTKYRINELRGIHNVVDFLPKPMCWEFPLNSDGRPSWQLERAIWIGLPA